MTNPLCWDSDGDSVKDSKDIDPLHNIILEVTLETGHIGYLPKWYLVVKNPPTMQLTVDYTLHGERLTFVSPHRDGSQGYAKNEIKVEYYDIFDLEWKEKVIWKAHIKSLNSLEPAPNLGRGQRPRLWKPLLAHCEISELQKL